MIATTTLTTLLMLVALVSGQERNLRSLQTTNDPIQFQLGETSVFPIGAMNVPDNVRYYVPDGHISSVKVIQGTNTTFRTFWSQAPSYMSVGSSPLKDDQGGFALQVPQATSDPAWRSGGLWLMAVLPIADNNWVGIWHGEDHYAPLANPEGIAWKSIGVSKSTDKGVTWTEPRKIITAKALKPSTPQWGGAGDCTAVWDSINKRIVILFQEKDNEGRALITAASTTDVTNLRGWKKWNGSKFYTAGLGGYGAPLANVINAPGANPSVQFNKYLNKWIMVWHGWDGNIYLSTSTNLTSWGQPQLVVPTQPGDRMWYPTLIDPLNGDGSPGDQVLDLYYAHMKSGQWQRDMLVRKLTLKK